MSSKVTNKKPSTFILILFSSYTVAAAVLFTPAIPDIINVLNISNSTIQTTIILFLLGYAFGQLLYGPINNKYGRKASLYFGFSLALVGELLSIIACYQYNISLLMIGRFLTATGACSGYSITFAIVHDCYSPKEARKTLAVIMLSFAVTPGIAILIGGILADNSGWESGFYSLFAYGIFLLCLIRRLPETSRHLDPSPIKLSRISEQYLSKFKNITFVLYGLGCSVWSAFLYIYYADAPLIVSVTKSTPLTGASCLGS